jgi:hypothetical protein
MFYNDGPKIKFLVNRQACLIWFNHFELFSQYFILFIIYDGPNKLVCLFPVKPFQASVL